MKKAVFSGMGMYIPETIVTNKQLEVLMDTSDEWITERTGIKERHKVKPGEGTAAVALPAAVMALANAKMAKEDIQLIIFSTIAGDFLAPGSGAILNEMLGVPGTPAVDIRQACSGFIFGMSMAKAYIQSGLYERILLVTAEVQSVALQMSTEGRDTAALFGDGAAAVVIIAEDGHKDSAGIGSIALHSDGRYAEDLSIQIPTTRETPFLSEQMIKDRRHWVVMNGRNVFKHAITKFPAVINEVMALEGITKDQVKLVIPHQANLRISEAVAKKMDLPMHSVVYSNIHKYGNTTSASIPIALFEAVQEGKVKKGDLIVMAAFGAGFSWGAAIYKW
jgi:3-oxoacyl-[acyl-carrier-protein] synthase III